MLSYIVEIELYFDRIIFIYWIILYIYMHAEQNQRYAHAEDIWVNKIL